MGVSAFLSWPSLGTRRPVCQLFSIDGHLRQKAAALEHSTGRVRGAPAGWRTLSMPRWRQPVLRVAPAMRVSMARSPPKRPPSPMDLLYMAPDLTEEEGSLLIVQAVDAQERLTASAGELSATRRDFETVDAWVAKQIDEGSFVGPVATAGALRLQQRVSILDEAQDAYDNDKKKLEGIIKRQQLQASIKTAVRKLSGNSFLGSLLAFTVDGRLRAYIESTPGFESGLLRRYLGPNITASAVNELHETRTNLRAVAYISGFPGRGKTL